MKTFGIQMDEGRTAAVDGDTTVAGMAEAPLNPRDSVQQLTNPRFTHC